MRTIYGVRREAVGGAELVKLGTCRLAFGGLDLVFREGELERFADELRPFVLLGDHLSPAWPAERIATLDRHDHTKIWANPKGKRKDRRPQVWRGHPVDDGLAILIAMVPGAKLAQYERKQDGFLRCVFPA